MPATSNSTARTLQWISSAILAGLVLYAVGDVLLLVFAGVLLAIPLRSLARLISERTGCSPGWALAGELLLAGVVIGLVAWKIAPEAARQTQDLLEQVPRSWQAAHRQFDGWLGDGVIDRIREEIGASGEASVGHFLSRSFGVVSGVLGAIGSMIVVAFIGLYAAADPEPYRAGLLRLVPPRRRDRAAEIISKLRSTLLWWLLGKLGSMSVVGVLTFLGLWWLNVPMMLALSLLACILTFIPNFGPIASAIPAILLALGEGPSQAMWVAGLYLGVQTVESYFVTPLIQERTVSLPPALTITTQLVAGTLAGIVGLALATPLTAAAVVLVRELYVKDVLESGSAKDETASADLK